MGVADYCFLCPGEISLHDDRWLTKPWGVNGGLPGARSSKTLIRFSDGKRIALPSKGDFIVVQEGDILEWYVLSHAYFLFLLLKAASQAYMGVRTVFRSCAASC